jgi:hypothetical protein
VISEQLDWNDPRTNHQKLLQFLADLRPDVDPVVRAVLARNERTPTAARDEWSLAWARVDICQPENLVLPEARSYGSARTIVVQLRADALLAAFEGAVNVVGAPLRLGVDVFSDHPCNKLWQAYRCSSQRSLWCDWPCTEIFSSDIRNVSMKAPLIGPTDEYFDDIFDLLVAFGGYRRSPRKANATVARINIAVWDRRARIAPPTYSVGKLVLGVDGTPPAGVVVRGRMRCADAWVPFRFDPSHPRPIDARSRPSELEARLIPENDVASWLDEWSGSVGEPSSNAPDVAVALPVEDADRIDAEAPANAARVIISCAHEDAELAAALIEFIEVAMKVPDGTILCTAVPGYGLAGGDVTADVLRESLRECAVVLGILTWRSIVSPFVLMELGAAWGLKTPAVPLLAPGVRFDDLPGPFKGMHALELHNAKAIAGLPDTLTRRAALEASALSAKTQAALGRLVAVAARHSPTVAARARQVADDVTADPGETVVRIRQWAMTEAPYGRVVLAELETRLNLAPGVATTACMQLAIGGRYLITTGDGSVFLEPTTPADSSPDDPH